MKPAKEWLNEVGETVATSMFAGGNPPGVEVERLIEQIQADAVCGTTTKLQKIVQRWRRDAGEYQANVNEARAKGLPHDQMLSMTTALNDCADQLEKLCPKNNG